MLYKPEFWEFEYFEHRYLENISDESLAQRHADIVRNMHCVVGGHRDHIPIDIIHGAWFWYRKEYQTRLEFALRVRDADNSPLPFAFDASMRSERFSQSVMNGTDKLYRLGEIGHIEAMAQRGILRAAPASIYSELNSDLARQDDERSKSSFWHGGTTKLTTGTGRDIPIMGDMRHTVSFPNYYVFSTACEVTPKMFNDFNSSACLEIKNARDFTSLLETESSRVLPGWYFHHNPVQYYDPYEHGVNERLDAPMCKDFKFAYQQEYRFLWFSEAGEDAGSAIFLELDSLLNIAEVIRH